MNLLILAGAMASCLLVASCTMNHENEAILETEPFPGPGNDPADSTPTSRILSSGPSVELRVQRVSISGQWVKVEVVNRTNVALSSIKGQVTFLDDRGIPIYDSLQRRDYQPFSYYKPQGIVSPGSRGHFTLETVVPSGSKEAVIYLKQASHTDGTVMQFKASLQ